MDESLIVQPDAEAQRAAIAQWVGKLPEALFARLNKEAKGVPVSFRLPEGMERQIDIVTQHSREMGLPWTTRTDLIRDAVIYFTEQVAARLADVDPFFESFAVSNFALDQMEFYRDVRKRADGGCKTLVAIGFEMIAAGEDEEARQQVRRFYTMVKGLPSRYVRNQYEFAIAANTQLQELAAALEVTK